MTWTSFSGILRTTAIFVVLSSVFLMGCSGNADSPVNKAEFQPLSSDSSSFYYYVSENRVPLTLSLKWIAVKFASGDPSQQSAALKGSIADSLEQAEQFSRYGVTLLPVKEGITFEALVEGINLLRANTADFLQVNPVFQAGDTGMIVTDEFIVTFPPEMSMDEINAVNASYGVELGDPILGQENTFVLQATTAAKMDTLSLANLYQESGVAVYAAPNFVRVK